MCSVNKHAFESCIADNRSKFNVENQDVVDNDNACSSARWPSVHADNNDNDDIDSFIVISLSSFGYRRSAVFSKIGQLYSYVEKERPSAMRGYKTGDDYGEERGWSHTHENGREI